MSKSYAGSLMEAKRFGKMVGRSVRSELVTMMGAG